MGWTAATLGTPGHAVPAGPTVAPEGAAAAPAGGQVIPFRGARQAGVDTEPAQARLSLLGLDLRPTVDAEALTRLLRLLTDDAARLTQGEPALADTDPELAQQPSRLTVTLGFGPRVIDRFGRPGVRLRPLPDFRTDRLEEAWGQTDLAVQLCCDDPITLAHARRMILKDAEAFTSLRWIQDGFRNARGTVEPGVTQRNLMGQIDGTGNPVPSDADFEQVLWDGDGGTTMVVRRIRMLLDKWDKVSREGKEVVVGRRLDTGAPLTGDQEHDVPDLSATDEYGLPVIDPASHVARARADGTQRILRRPYNYAVPDPSRPSGEDAGLVFLAFARDVERQFVPIQRRLAELDRLNEWVTTIGSAVYAVPPGIPETPAGGTPYLGETILRKEQA